MFGAWEHVDHGYLFYLHALFNKISGIPCESGWVA
jgi:hypothetical protein